jgi:hypothetical protein
LNQGDLRLVEAALSRLSYRNVADEGGSNHHGLAAGWLL